MTTITADIRARSLPPQSKVTDSPVFSNNVSLTKGVSPGDDKSPARCISLEWHVDFETPDFYTFSSNVKEAIDSGGITGIAQSEIIQVLCTYTQFHQTLNSIPN